MSSFFGGPSEVVEDGKTGYLVNPMDERSMADRITLLLTSEERAARMGRAGRLRAEAMFDMKKTLGDTQALYESLV